MVKYRQISYLAVNRPKPTRSPIGTFPEWLTIAQGVQTPNPRKF